MSSRNVGPGLDGRGTTEGSTDVGSVPTAAARTPTDPSKGNSRSTSDQELLLPKAPGADSHGDTRHANVDSAATVDPEQPTVFQHSANIGHSDVCLSSPTLDQIRNRFLESFPTLSDVTAAAESIQNLANTFTNTLSRPSTGSQSDQTLRSDQTLSQAAAVTLASLESLATHAAHALPTSIPQTIGSLLTSVLSTGLRNGSQDPDASPEVNRTFVEQLVGLHQNYSSYYAANKGNYSEQQQERITKDIAALDSLCRELEGVFARCEKANEERQNLILEHLDPATQQKEIERVCRIGERCRRGILEAREELAQQKLAARAELTDPTKTKEERIAAIDAFSEHGEDIGEGEIERLEQQPALLEQAIGSEAYRFVADGIAEIQRTAVQATRAILNHFSALSVAWREAVQTDWAHGNQLSDYLPRDYQGWSTNEAAQSKDFFGSPPGDSLYAALMSERSSWGSSELLATESSDSSDIPLKFQQLSRTLFGESIIEQPLHKSREDLYAERDRRESQQAKLELNRRGEETVPTALDGTISRADQLRAKTTPNR